MKLRRIQAVVGGLALAVSVLAVPGQASPTAVPESVNISDPAGDANSVSALDAIQNASAPADLSASADILNVWFTSDEHTLSVHIHTEAPPGGTEGLFSWVYATPKGGSPNCLFFGAQHHGSTFQYEYMRQAYVWDTCTASQNMYSWGDLQVHELEDGTGISTMTFPRAYTPFLGRRATLTSPRAGTQVLVGGFDWPVPWVWQTTPTIDDTAPGRAYKLENGNSTAAPLVASLTANESIFWDGEPWKQTGRAFFYRLKVDDDARRLRVAVDSPATTRDWTSMSAVLIDPNSKVTSFTPYREALVEDPVSGTWTIVARSSYGDKGVFRMRAKLESALPNGGGPKRLLKPNLRSLPPYDFTFEDPITYEGDHTVSCNADEMVEERARRCLRFSVGPENVGDGLFEINFRPLSEAGASGVAAAFQRLHFSDGTKKMRPAGNYEYHKTHQHYHYAGFASMELFAVEDENEGLLKPVGEGKKIGFCTYDVVMADWYKFNQDPRDTAASACDDTGDAWIGLSTGWVDIYDWSTSGNYVDFGNNPDGLYVLRSAFDRNNLVVETNELDNFSYALVRIEGNEIEVIERGYGMDPWDPYKSVVRDWWK